MGFLPLIASSDNESFPLHLSDTVIMKVYRSVAGTFVWRPSLLLSMHLNRLKLDLID